MASDGQVALGVLALWWLTRGRAVPPGRRRVTSAAVPAHGWEPIDGEDVALRAAAQASVPAGAYRLGGGAHFEDDSVFGALGNRFPGTSDCTGLLAYAGRYHRGPWNTDAIVADARGPRHRFRLVDRAESVRPGDFLVTGNGPNGPDHAGVIVEVLPTFVRGGPRWWESLRVAHARWPAPRAVRVTDARIWRRTGYIIRALHVA